MPYCTLEQLTDRYTERLLLQLSDRAQPPTGEIDEGVVDRAIADTEAQIDGYLAGRYQLPLTETPPRITDLALQIAIYKLHVYAPDPKVADDYKLAIAELDKIAKGTVRLPLAGVEPAATDGSGVLTNDRERPVSADNLRGFI